MTVDGPARSRADIPDDVVEPWWCPVCDAPAHRTRRPGRPKLYCSNACRQRAYRWRRDHHARTVARPYHPADGAFVSFGRRHALRTGRDFVAGLTDRRRRQPTICGVLARPTRLLPGVTHSKFVPVSSNACRTCAALILPPLDPLAPAGAGISAYDRGEPIDHETAWIESLDPTHPIRRYPERFG